MLTQTIHCITQPVPLQCLPLKTQSIKSLSADFIASQQVVSPYIFVSQKPTELLTGMLSSTSAVGGILVFSLAVGGHHWYCLHSITLRKSKSRQKHEKWKVKFPCHTEISPPAVSRWIGSLCGRSKQLNIPPCKIIPMPPFNLGEWKLQLHFLQVHNPIYCLCFGLA